MIEAESLYAIDRRTWWSARRKRYNMALILAAPLSLVATLTVWGLFEDRLPCLEISGFSVIAGIPIFAIGLALANVCYNLGSLSERIVRPRNVVRFRSVVFGAGLVLSLFLIFTPPIANLAAALLGPVPCTDKFGVRHGTAPEYSPSSAKHKSGRITAAAPSTQSLAT